MVSYICLQGKKKKTLTSPKPPFNKKPEVSIILPTYNEEENIEETTSQLRSLFKNESYEIVILDDNSKDKTPQIINRLALKGDVLAIHRKDKKGYWSAYQDAIALCHGKYILTMDADLSHPPKTAFALYKNRKEADIITASRFMKGGGMQAPFTRKFGSMFLNHFGKIVMSLPYTDISGDFHIMEKAKFNKIKFRYEHAFGDFDFEWLYRSKKLGFTNKDVPFTYIFREEGESAMGSGMKDAIKLLSFAWSYMKMAMKLRFKG
jgi:dolichol-phosphate mannosyltransferase